VYRTTLASGSAFAVRGTERIRHLSADPAAPAAAPIFFVATRMTNTSAGR
jgi:hypothetical protein